MLKRQIHNIIMRKQKLRRKKYTIHDIQNKIIQKLRFILKFYQKKGFHFKSIFYICERKQAFCYFKIKSESGYP